MLRGHKTETPYHGLRNQIRQSRCSEAPCDPGGEFQSQLHSLSTAAPGPGASSGLATHTVGFRGGFCAALTRGVWKSWVLFASPQTADQRWPGMGMVAHPRSSRDAAASSVLPGDFPRAPTVSFCSKSFAVVFYQNMIHQTSFSEVSEAFENVQTPLLFSLFFTEGTGDPASFSRQIT